MANFSKSELNNAKYGYSWVRTEGDSKVTGYPDNVLLNRNEGYEVLHFINKYMTDKGLTSLGDFQKLERSIKENVPPNYRSHAHIRQWLDANFR